MYGTSGSTTFTRKDLARGFEPDTYFYIQNAERVLGKEEIDLISSSLNKLPIYVAVSVPEVWHYDGKKLTIFTLVEGKYSEREESAALPRLTSDLITDFIYEGTTLKRSVRLRKLREWVRGQHF